MDIKQAYPKTILAKMAHDIARSFIEARIDIRNKGMEGNDLLIDDISDHDCVVMTPNWFNKVGVGYMFMSIRGKIKISFECVKDGILNIWLHSGVYQDSCGKRIPVWVDYDYLAINEKVIFSEDKATWHDKPFYMDRPVKDGEKLILEISWHPHIWEPVLLQNTVYLLEQRFLSRVLSPFDCTDVYTGGDSDRQKPTFTILGICVSRDIVGAAGFKVNRFVQDVSPISLFYGSVLGNGFRLDEENIKCYLANTKLNHFFIRNTILDMNKTVYEYLFEVQSDWLVIDAGCLRHKTLIDRERKTAVTEAHLKRLKYRYDENIYQLYETMTLEEKEFDICMGACLARLLREYPEEKIIVVESYLVSHYVDAKRSGIHKFKREIKNENAAISMGHDYLKRNLKKSHFIPFPAHILADASHKWGLAPLHYVPEYYEYGSRALKIIMRELSCEEERKVIEELKSYYQDKMKYEYFY